MLIFTPMRVKLVMIQLSLDSLPDPHEVKPTRFNIVPCTHLADLAHLARINVEHAALRCRRHVWYIFREMMIRRRIYET